MTRGGVSRDIASPEIGEHVEYETGQGGTGSNKYFGEVRTRIEHELVRTKVKQLSIRVGRRLELLRNLCGRLNQKGAFTTILAPISAMPNNS